MVKTKNLEKKGKTNAEFDQKNPGNRVKSIKEGKMKKKAAKVKKPAVLGGAVEKDVKPLVKEVKKEIEKAQKAKNNLLKKPASKDKVEVDVPAELASRQTIKAAVKAVKAGIDKEKEDAATQNLFDDELRIGIQVVAMKIAKIPPHTKRILLDHSLFGDEQPDICFIIRDQKNKKDTLVVDETVLKFEEMLKANGVTNIKTILPISKLKKDYGPNNMKMKLLNTYDVFFVEAEIAEHVYSILGKHFITKRKRPIQIDTSKTELLKDIIEKGQRKVTFKLGSTSQISVFEIGTYKMECAKIVDNVAAAIEQLKQKWPGGWKNVLRLYLKPMKPSKISIPIYYSKINPNDVEVPVEVGAKQTRLDKLNEMLAKKSKKLRLDKKQKKIVKAKGEAPPTKTKKDKKRKLDKSNDGETKPKKEKKSTESETAPVETAKKEKKNKKASESETPAVVETEKKGKKQKKTSVSEVPIADEDGQTSKKKKKNSESEATTEPAKKQKKQKVQVAEPANEPEKPSKKKNKQKM